MIQKHLFLFPFLLLIHFSCKKDSGPFPSDPGYEYFPDDPGMYVIYEGDSTIYDDFKNDTTYVKFQLKERIESVFTDNEGRPSLRTERYVKYYNSSKPYDSIPWTLKNVCYAVRTTSSLERLENNVRFVKLVFPVKENKKWNGNALNAKEEWEYKYKEADISLVLNNLSFDSSLTVLQRDDITVFSRQYYIEKYAKNVGLVSREVVDIETDILGNIKKGIQVNYKIVKFGKQ